jgi:hypothetical protein
MITNNLHILFRVGFNKINTNKNKAFLPEEIDVILNESLKQCVSNILDETANARKEGYSDTQYRLDLIQDHIDVLDTDNEALSLDSFNRGKKVTLPLDIYYALVGSTSDVKNPCITVLSSNNRLYKTGYELNSALNDVLTTSGIDSPISELRGNVLYVYENKFTIERIELQFIKKLPILSYESQDILPFTDDLWRLVINIAIVKANAISDGRYEILNNETIKAE